MELKAFIKESLSQITDGIIDANAALSEKGAVVNPRWIEAYSSNAQAFGRTCQENDTTGQLVQNVELDLVLQVEAGSEKGGGLKISIASLGIGGEATSQQSTSTQSRLRFKVPMVFPSPGEK